MKWVTVGEYRKMSPRDREAVIKKEIEQSKDMSLDDLYRELGKVDL